MDGRGVIVSSLFIFLFLSMLSLPSVVSGTPTIINKAFFKDVMAGGSNFSIVCQGDQPMLWDFPENENTGNVTMSVEETLDDASSMISSRATFFGVTVFQNGWYSCYYSAMERPEVEWEHNHTTSNVYVYVDDGDNLFVPPQKDQVMIGGMLEDRVVIPCATTNPAAEAWIEIPRQENRRPEQTTFIPNVGFIMQKAHKTFLTDPTLLCNAKLADRTQERAIILILRTEWTVKKPQITAFHLYGQARQGKELFVKKNENVTLECRNSIYDHSTSVMTWKDPSGNLMHTTIKDNEDQNHRVISAMIPSFQAGNAGMYTCRTFNQQNEEEQNSASVTLTFLEKDTVTVKPPERTIFPISMQKIQLKVVMQSKYRPRIKWKYSPFGEAEVWEDVPTKRHIFQAGPDRTKVVADEWQATLTFFKAGFKDEGRYKLDILDQLPEDYSPQKYVIYEQARPGFVNKHLKQWSIAPPETPQTLRCIFKTHPYPSTITLSHQVHKMESNIYYYQGNEKYHWEVIPDSEYTITQSGHKKVVTLNATSSETGAYKCDGINHEGIYGTAYYAAYVAKNHSDFGIVKENNKIQQNYNQFLQTPINIRCVGKSDTYDKLDLFSINSVGFGDEVVPDSSETEADTLVVRKMIDPQEDKRVDKFYYVCRGTKKGEAGFDYDFALYSPLGEDSLIYDVTDDDVEISSSTGINNSRASIWIPLCVVAFLALAVMLVLLFVQRKRSRKRELEALKSPFELYLKPKENQKYDPEIPLDQQTECLAYDPAWEIPKENLKLESILGQGAFGRVMKGKVVGLRDGEMETAVAVKMVKDITNNDQVQALLSELKILIHIGTHLNIVNLIGAVTTHVNKGIFYVLVEYCSKGCLRNYLMAHKKNFVRVPLDGEDDVEFSMDRGDGKVAKLKDYSQTNNNDQNRLSVDIPSNYPPTNNTLNTNNNSNNNKPTNNINPPSPSHTDQRYVNDPTKANENALNTVPNDGEIVSTKDIVCFAYQIARGMDYLASKKLLHRDLAARNILLAEDNVVKICDFGLAKDCYKYEEYNKKSDAPVPIKWMAIESLTHKVYTSKSDVWSFGVMLWEMFTFGGNPYAGFEMNDKFVKKLKDGLRLTKPNMCPTRVYEVMESCWREQADERPSFDQLVTTLGDMLETSVQQAYLDMDTVLQSDPVYLKPRNQYLSMKSSEDTPLIDKSNRTQNDYVTDKMRLSDVPESCEGGDDGGNNGGNDSSGGRGDDGGRIGGVGEIGGECGGNNQREGDDMVDNYV